MSRAHPSRWRAGPRRRPRRRGRIGCGDSDVVDSKAGWSQFRSSNIRRRRRMRASRPAPTARAGSAPHRGLHGARRRRTSDAAGFGDGERRAHRRRIRAAAAAALRRRQPSNSTRWWRRRWPIAQLIAAANARWAAANKVPSQVGTLPDPQVTMQEFTVGRPKPSEGYESSDFYYTGSAPSRTFPDRASCAWPRQPPATTPTRRAINSSPASARSPRACSRARLIFFTPPRRSRCWSKSAPTFCVSERWPRRSTGSGWAGGRTC